LYYYIYKYIVSAKPPASRGQCKATYRVCTEGQSSTYKRYMIYVYATCGVLY
jgi:hypothetical protein